MAKSSYHSQVGRAGRTAMVLSIVVACVGCSRSPDRPLNVVLISVDTLRADRLGYSGYDRETSPHLDRLAREGVVFRNAYSQSGWTTPSMASLMTGLYPQQHGATRFDTPIKEHVFTLAELLRAEGYSARAYVSNSLVGRAYRFDRGFTEFDASILRGGHPGQRETSKGLSERVIGDIGNLTEPFFLWLHYMDPHRAFLPHEVHDFGESDADLYDGEIAHTDAFIGTVIEALEERGLLDWTVVVVTADHGEELGEHGGTGHFSLHEEVLRVPLVIRSPTLDPRTVDSPVSQIDLLPTLFGILGKEPRTGWPGRDVLAESDAGRPLLFERQHPGSYRQRAVIYAGYKLIYIDENPGPRSKIEDLEYDGLAELETGMWLYELTSDPAEERNLLPQREEEAAELLAILKSHFEDVEPPEATIEITKEREEGLRSLGYIR